mgnify:CR=1 FL=1
MKNNFCHYFKFTGRAPRAELWKVMFACWLLQIIMFTVIILLVSMILPSVQIEERTSLIMLLVATLPFYPLIFATLVRRMHDLNWNGWWLALLFLEILVFEIGEAVFENTGTFFWWMWVFVPPLIGSHLLLCYGMLALFLAKGTKGTNNYGANPRDP